MLKNDKLYGHPALASKRAPHPTYHPILFVFWSLSSKTTTPLCLRSLFPGLPTAVALKMCLPSTLVNLFLLWPFGFWARPFRWIIWKTMSGDAHQKSVFSWSLEVVGYGGGSGRLGLTIYHPSIPIHWLFQCSLTLQGSCSGFNQKTFTQHQQIAIMYSVSYLLEQQGPREGEEKHWESCLGGVADFY